METITDKEVAKIWFDDSNIYIQTIDGREFRQSLLWYRRLQCATDEQRANYRMSYSGIHWPDVDEDVSFESFLYDNPEPTGISRFFLTHPELNVSAIARRMGMKPSLMGAYICGTKKPSVDREKEIISAVKQIGKELCDFGACD
ncbi:MAG: DUF2442 domain-containing protein [Tannerella sp.]|jgi:hypothetical protein|nr:DUF2442 domain-containing protein [Tannerella sp.]